MDCVYHLSFDISDLHADRFGRLKSSSILYFVQEAAGRHWKHIEGETSQNCPLYWVIIRHRLQVTRLPRKGETIHLETWPMPTTRVAYPRSVVAYDENGNELFRSVSLWVLMDPETRAMVLPGKSGVELEGTLRGLELASPRSLSPRTMEATRIRSVCFTDLDINGHMNNTRYLDWIMDLLPSGFHQGHAIKDLTLCYMNEAREGQDLNLGWEIDETGALQVEIRRSKDDPTGDYDRIFAARVEFDDGVL